MTKADPQTSPSEEEECKLLETKIAQIKKRRYYHMQTENDSEEWMAESELLERKLQLLKKQLNDL